MISAVIFGIGELHFRCRIMWFAVRKHSSGSPGEHRLKGTMSTSSSFQSDLEDFNRKLSHSLPKSGEEKKQLQRQEHEGKKETDDFAYIRCCLPYREWGFWGQSFTGFTENFHKLCSHPALTVPREKGFTASTSHGANPMVGKRQKQDSHPFSAFLSRLSTVTVNLRKKGATVIGNNKRATSENYQAETSAGILKENMLTFFKKKNDYLVIYKITIYSKVHGAKPHISLRVNH